MSAGPQRIAFFLWNAWFFRNFAGVIADLAARGYRVTIVFQRTEAEPSSQRALEQLIARYPKVETRLLPERSDGYGPLAKALSRAIDYLYFQRPVFADKPVLRIRMRHRTHPAIRLLAHPFSHATLREPALRVLLAFERALPRSAAIVEALRALQPRLAVFSPLIDVAINQFEHLRTAQQLGIPTLFAVHSWDNLSTKSLLREATDAVAVWNFEQVEEAVSLHGVPRERIIATGAPTYDRCFDYRPSEDREVFLARLGLDPEQRTLLYVSSATFGFREARETEFARRWIAAVRSSDDPHIARANIIIRPHPKRPAEWIDTPTFGPGVVIFPREAENPADDSSFDAYALSLSHSECVVGINTSAMIEAGIFGKPVLTVLDPAHADSQSGTFHFNYLLKQGDRIGLLRAAGSFAEHIGQLRAALDRSREEAAETRACAASFVRPFGQHVCATPVFADLVERLCSRPAEARSSMTTATRLQRAARPALAAVSALIRAAHATVGPLRARSSR